MGTRAESAAETKRQVVDAARKLFLAGGFEKVTIRDVAKAAKRSTGSVFCHFKGKHELFRECIGVDPDPEEFLRALLTAGDEDGTALLKLGHFVEAYYGVKP